MVSLNNAEDVFGEVLLELMDELHYDRFDASEQRLAIHDAFEEFMPTWDEFVLWVRFGDDKKAKTLALVRAGMRR